MSLKLKTVFGVALIEAILLALLIFTVTKYNYDNAEEALLKRVQTTAALFSVTAKDPVLAFDLASLETFSHELSRNRDIEYVRTRSSDGILLSSAGDEDLVDKPFTEDFKLNLVDDGIFDTSAVVSESGVEYARVEIGFSISSIEASLNEAKRLVTLIAIIEMVLVAVFSYILGTYLTRQLLVLRSAAKLVSQGEYSQQLKIVSNDEVSDVADAFNHMASTLRESQQDRDQYESQLLDLNKTLEARVNTRTEKIRVQMEELQVTHEKLADTQAKLSQAEKLASIGELSAGIAHEINNPLSFINSNVNSLVSYIDIYQKLIEMHKSALISDSNACPDKLAAIAEYESHEDIDFVNEDILSLLEDTLEGTTRVRDIVNGLRDFAHVNQDTKEPCDVVECIKSTLRIVKPELQAKCTLHTEFNSIPPVLANRGELNQVIMNLLINATQSVGATGHIVLKTAVLDTMVMFSISDNGSGIAGENLKRLFDPFFTTKPVGVGTGLGLSISYGIVQDHGGTINVESVLGEGTTFTVSLPMLENIELSKAA